MPRQNDVLQSKPKAPLVKPKTHKCLKCGQTKPITDFYQNSGWTDNDCVDKWCIACFKALRSQSEVREYFWENNREWSDQLWESAVLTAQKKLETSAPYRNGTPERRAQLVISATLSVLPTNMNKSMYSYLKKKPAEQNLTYQEAVTAGILPPDRSEDDNPLAKKYSEFFNGNFNEKELQYMQNYYDKLDSKLNFDDENIRDYARKCARLSMIADRAMDDYVAGRCSFADVKDATAQFDTLSKSANFAACKRKEEEKASITSWSEMTAKLESSGHPCTRKIEWPEDSVDRTINEYRHIVSSLQLDQI